MLTVLFVLLVSAIVAILMIKAKAKEEGLKELTPDNYLPAIDFISNSLVSLARQNSLIDYHEIFFKRRNSTIKEAVIVKRFVNVPEKFFEKGIQGLCCLHNGESTIQVLNKGSLLSIKWVFIHELVHTRWCNVVDNQLWATCPEERVAEATAAILTYPHKVEEIINDFLSPVTLFNNYDFYLKYNKS